MWGDRYVTYMREEGGLAEFLEVEVETRTNGGLFVN